MSPLTTRIALVLAVVAGVIAPAVPAAAAGCGLFGLFSCSDPGSRTPGTAVTPVTQWNQSTQGGTNPKLGSVPSTATIGTPNPGVVPVLGKVTAKADDGAYVLYESRVDSRTVDLMVSSPALGGDAPVRVQLPIGWTTKLTATWPTLYLLHGGDDKADYQSWSLYTRADEYLSKAAALVVEPSIGSAAYASNYWNFYLGGSNQYDTFIATELPQLLQRGYRASTRAAVAGISSGGYSALALAMLHPGEYGAAASYSGLADTQLPFVAQSIEFGPLLEFQVPAAMWGDSIAQLPIWDSRNPTAHVDKLKGTRVFVSSGNGSAGPLDTPGTSDPLEPVTLVSTESFLAKAKAQGVPVTADLYGPGEHNWKYWYRELQRSWPILSAGLGLTS